MVNMPLYRRNARVVGADLVDHFPITVIQGARQVGKSTLAAMLADGREATSVTLDDVDTRAAIDADAPAFVDQASGGLMVIDEIQLRPALLRTIKANVDRDRRPGRFLLTGSANVLRLQGETDSLAGRAVTLRLRGLSQGELLGLTDDFVARVRSSQGWPSQVGSDWTRRDYVDAMLRGGFPEVQSMPERLVGRWLDSYLERALERDATVLPGGGSAARIRSVARLLAANQSGELVKARIAEQAHIPQTSITAYLDALEGIYLIETIPSWTPNLTRREIGRPKVLIADSALALRLAAVSRGELESLGSSAIGGFLEAFVVSELLKQREWSAEEYRLQHFRDRSGIEVDIIIELADGAVIAVEVKAASTFKREHFGGLEVLKAKLGERLIAGIVLGTSPRAYQYAERLWGLPISSLWRW